MAIQFNQTDIRWRTAARENESSAIRDLKTSLGVVLLLKKQGVIVLHDLLYQSIAAHINDWKATGALAFKWFPGRVFREISAKKDFETPNCVGLCGPSAGCGQALCFCVDNKCTPMTLAPN